MTLLELEEYASEDIGFRLASGKNGVVLFDEPIDFEAVQDVPLHLLAMGNVKKLYAVSNTKQIGVGSLRDLDDAETAKLKLHTIPLASVTCLAFNSFNDVLYVVSGSNVLSASVADVIGGVSSPFTAITTCGDVTDFGASPMSPLTYFYLQKNKTLTIVNNGSEKSISDVNAAAWDIKGQTLGLVTDQFFQIVTADGSNLHSEKSPGRAISCIDTESWFIVGRDEDGEDMHLIVKHGEAQSVSQVLLAPPFGGVERNDSLYSTSLIEWSPGTSFAFITSGLSTDISTIECGTNNRLVTQLNDTDRAELPMDDDSGDDTLPVGFSVDLSGTYLTVKEPCQAVDEAVGVLPRLLCLNNLGNLLIWYIFDSSGLKNNTLSLERASDAITTKGPSATDAPLVKQEFVPTEPQAEAKPLQEELQPGFGSIEKPKSSIDSSGFGSSGFGSKEESKSSFGSSGFGSSGFGSTGFGNKEDSKSRSDSPFGSSSFGASGFGSTALSLGQDDKVDENNTNRKSAFGSGGFGSSGNNSGALAFGQSSFGTNKPMFGSTTSFGSSGFGSKPIATSSKPSNFASFGSINASFSSSKAESPFGSTKPSTDSPFGLTKPSTESPFGSNKPFNDSPFGSTEASTDSPFGSLKLAANPIGSTKPDTDSSFGLKKTNSPFESTTSSTASPFGSFAPSTGLPFGPTKLASGSLFPAPDETAKSKDEDQLDSYNPFGGLKLSDSSDTAKPTGLSLLGSQQAPVDSSVGLSLRPTFSLNKECDEDAQIQSKNEVLATKTEKSDKTLPSRSVQFGSLKLDKKEPSPFSVLKQTKINEEEAKKKSANEPSDSLKLFGSLNLEGNTHPITSTSPFNDSMTSISNQGAAESGSLTESLNELGDDSEEADESLSVNQSPVQPASNKAPLAKVLSSPKTEVLKATLKLSAGLKQDQKKLPAPGPNVFEQFKSGLVAPQREISKVNEATQASTQIEEKDVPQVPDIKFESLLSFSGWTSKPPAQKSEMLNKIADLLQSSQANMTVLERNAAIIDKLVKNCEFAEVKLHSKDLQDPKQWTLGVIDTLNQLAKNAGEEIGRDLALVTQQDKALSDLMDLVEKSVNLKEQILRIVSQIVMFKQEIESPKTVNRPLDVKSQTMCYKLRRKLTEVQSRHDNALENILQVTMKKKVDSDFVKKLSQVVYEIHAKAKQYSEDIDELENTLEQVTTPKLLTSGEDHGSAHTFTNFKQQKWDLAAKFANNTIVRNVTLSQI